MNIFKTLFAASLLVALATGCTSTRDNESMLSAAGFKMISANTPERQAHLQSLPPNEITPVQRDGAVYYTFPDPKRNVLFVGQEPQYQEYQRLRFQDQAAMHGQVNAARMEGTEAWWGVWGPFNNPAFALQ